MSYWQCQSRSGQLQSLNSHLSSAFVRDHSEKHSCGVWYRFLAAEIVAAEIVALLREFDVSQFWRVFVKAVESALQVDEIAWGRHFPEGTELECRSPTSVEEGDLIQVALSRAMSAPAKCKKKGQETIQHTIGTIPQVNTMNVEATASVGVVRETFKSLHKDKPVEQTRARSRTGSHEA
jgi:hypothetical protein